MPQFFFDTSAFAKRYHEEAGAARVTSIFETTASVFQLSNLGVLETRSAFAMKVRTGEIVEGKAVALHSALLADIAKNVVSVIMVDPIHFGLAAVLISKYGYTRRMRTLDALQLAVALDLRRKGLLDIFVVADKLLAEIAALEGLTPLNPEDSP